MTRTIPHRELRNNSASVLRDVAAGETIKVTNHGEIVAVLIPPSKPARPPMRAATVSGGFASLPRTATTESTQTVLDDLRSER